MSAFIMICCRVHADDSCAPDYIGIFRADDPAYEYVQVKWKGHNYRKYFKGRVADHDGPNERALTEWILSLPENECNPSKS